MREAAAVTPPYCAAWWAAVKTGGLSLQTSCALRGLAQLSRMLPPAPRDGLGTAHDQRRGRTIASWAAFTGESGGRPVSTRTTSCAAKSRTVRIASSE